METWPRSHGLIAIRSLASMAGEISREDELCLDPAWCHSIIEIYCGNQWKILVFINLLPCERWRLKDALFPFWGEWHLCSAFPSFTTAEKKKSDLYCLHQHWNICHYGLTITLSSNVLVFTKIYRIGKRRKQVSQGLSISLLLLC